MPTALKQRAWEALGTALRSKGLGMVLAYWAQGRTTRYKELGAWDTFWLNGACDAPGASPSASPSGAPYPRRDTMGWACLSHIQVEANPPGTAPQLPLSAAGDATGGAAWDPRGGLWGGEADRKSVV